MACPVVVASTTTSCEQHHHLVVHIVAITSRASASRSASTAPALLPVVIAGPALSSRWGTHKGKVDGDLLLKQLLAVGTLDGGVGFVEGGVFNENVALQYISPRMLVTARDNLP
jgi:hypothetical protein